MPFRDVPSVTSLPTLMGTHQNKGHFKHCLLLPLANPPLLSALSPLQSLSPSFFPPTLSSLLSLSSLTLFFIPSFNFLPVSLPPLSQCLCISISNSIIPSLSLSLPSSLTFFFLLSFTFFPLFSYFYPSLSTSLLPPLSPPPLLRPD